MPLYCKVALKNYEEGSLGSSEETAASLDDLKHEAKRLVGRQGPKFDPLLFATPQQWHKKFIDELLQPDDWQPPEGGAFAFTPADIFKLCDAVEAKLRAEPSLLEVQAPIKVFGDLHGQFTDFLRLLKAFGVPNRMGDIGCVDYLFLGDYVDRGPHSLETICLLLALKIEYPRHVHLLRGNHEVAEVNERYGFLKECRQRLGAVPGFEVWLRINSVFNWLPLAARIDGSILCMHGGISTELVCCSQIASIRRPLFLGPEDINDEDARLAHHLLWNDPNQSDAVVGAHANSRGRDIQTFSAEQVEAFCQANDLDLIIRAHECVRDGIERFARGRLLTVFSVANYCGLRNAGALLLVGRDHVVVPKVVHPSLRPPLAAPQAASGAAAGAVAGAAAGTAVGTESQMVSVPLGAARAAPAGKHAVGLAGQEAAPAAAAAEAAGRRGSEGGELAAAAGLTVAQLQAVQASSTQQAGHDRAAEAPPACKLPKPGRVLVAVAAGADASPGWPSHSSAASSCHSGGTLLERLGIEREPVPAAAAADSNSSKSSGGGREQDTCAAKGVSAAKSRFRVHVMASPAGQNDSGEGGQAEELWPEEPELKGGKAGDSGPGPGTVLGMCSALAMLASLGLSAP